MRSSTPQLNVEHYRPEQYRAHYGSKITIPRSPYRNSRNLIAPMGLAFGIFAILGSWVPYFNFFFLAFAILGVLMSTIVFVHPQKTRLNKKESLLGLTLNGIAILVFFSTYIIIYLASPPGNSYFINGQARVNDYAAATEQRNGDTVIVAPSAVGGVSENPEEKANENPLGQKSRSEADTRIINDPFGRRVAVNGLEVVVNGVEEKSAVSSHEGSQKAARPGGKFAVIDVTLINMANAPYSFFRPDDFFVLTTCDTLDGNCPQYYEYEESIGAIDDYAFGKTLAPRLETHAKLVYEIPDNSSRIWLGIANLKKELADKRQSLETYKGAYLLKLK